MAPTSCTWSEEWPVKPDIVFEGGNGVNDDNQILNHPDLGLLTTSAQLRLRYLEAAFGTSASSALSARYAAIIQQAYPQYWPETLRALLVHSADWTRAMQAGRKLKRKADVIDMIRHFGHGEPNLARALHTAQSEVTLVVQDEFVPFRKVKSDIKTNEMRLHTLPWPKDVLEGIPNANVTMKVTLSYFVEPNPGHRLTNDRYRYGSCHLRFEVKRPHEKEKTFRQRINRADREKDYSTSGGSDSNKWLIGSDMRHRGSLHQDIWKGSAADLGSKASIAVYPVTGWWKLRPHLRRYDSPIRYALAVSIASREQPVDLYTPIATQLGLPLPAEIQAT